MHDEKWQYMNGGMAGHAIGEMARGAYENGYENYASDIMDYELMLSKNMKTDSGLLIQVRSLLLHLNQYLKQIDIQPKPIWIYWIKEVREYLVGWMPDRLRK